MIDRSLFSLRFISLSEERKGEIYIFLETILWGLFPILAFVSLSTLGPLFSAAICQLLSMLVFLPFAIKSSTFKNIRESYVLKPVLLSTLLIGVIFYSLIFVAGKYEDPVTMAILLLFEVPATYIVLLLFGKERVRLKQAAGGFCVMFASFLAIYKDGLTFSLGGLIVLIAVFFAPMGNYYNKVAREHVAAPVFLFLRGVFSSIFLFVLAFSFEDFPGIDDISDSWFFILANGLLVFGLSKIFWIEGIYRIPINKAISINSMFPVVTMIGSYFFLDIIPRGLQVFALIPAILGVYLLTSKKVSA